MGLFKKKDGSPSLFGKITKTALGVGSLAAAVLPIPAGGAISKLTSKVSGVIGKASNVLQSKSGGVLNLSNLTQRGDESATDYVSRLKSDVIQGAGGAVAGFANATNTDADQSKTGNQQFVDGATKTTIGKYTPYIIMAAIAAVGVIIIKKK